MTGAEAWALVGGCLAAILIGIAAGAVVNLLADRVVGVDEPIWSATQCRACLAPLPAPSWWALAEFTHPRLCEKCGKRASLRRPLVQAILPLLFVALTARMILNPTFTSAKVTLPAWAVILVGMALLSSLAFVFVVDLEHRLIYDLSIWPALALILLVAGIHNLRALPALALGGVACGGLFLLFYGLGWLIYRQEALGLGDVKLAALMGVAVGWFGLASALGVTMVIGFIAALLMLAVDTSSRRTFIPFGIFMALGVVTTILWAPIAW